MQAATGYQRLMAFRQPDGSFSQEIGENAAPDVWLAQQQIFSRDFCLEIWGLDVLSIFTTFFIEDI